MKNSPIYQRFKAEVERRELTAAQVKSLTDEQINSALSPTANLPSRFIRNMKRLIWNDYFLPREQAEFRGDLRERLERLWPDVEFEADRVDEYPRIVVWPKGKPQENS